MLRIMETWEAAYRALPNPTVEPSTIIVPGANEDTEWTVLAYVEHAVDGADLLEAADHLMVHLVSEPPPPWLGHAAVAFAKTTTDPDEVDGRSLQEAAAAGDDTVREVLLVTLCDRTGVYAQEFSRPLNEPRGEVMQGITYGMVGFVLTAMLEALHG
jgi:hypothetical protein